MQGQSNPYPYDSFHFHYVHIKFYFYIKFTIKCLWSFKVVSCCYVHLILPVIVLLSYIMIVVNGSLRNTDNGLQKL